MTESNDIIQSFVKNVFEHNDVDFEALSVATKKMAESAFEASKVDFTSIQIAAKQMLKVLGTSKKLDDKTKNQYVSDEASNLANNIVYRLEYSPTFKDCTFNINVPENSKHWTRSEIISLIQLIVAILAFVAGYVYSPPQESNVADDFTQEVNQLIVDTNKLANLSVDSVNPTHLDEAA